jgi:hypothetical protein
VGGVVGSRARHLADRNVATAGISLFSILSVRSLGHDVAAALLLQNRSGTFISSALSLEPGGICMISSFSQIALSRPKLSAMQMANRMASQMAKQTSNHMANASLLDARSAL